MEVAAAVRMGIFGIEVGRRIRIMVTVEFCLGVGLDNRSALFGYENAAHLGCERLEGFHHVGVVSVDVKVVRIHRRNHGNLREKLQERAVEFVGFGNNRGRMGHQEISAIVTGNAAEERAAALSALREDVGGKGGGCGFSVGSGNGKAPLALGNLSKGAGTLEKGVSAFAGLHHFPKVLGHCRRINHQGLIYVGGNEVRPVLVVHGDAFGLKLGRELRRRTVVSSHAITLELVVTCQRGHSNSANSYEVYVFHTKL